LIPRLSFKQRLYLALTAAPSLAGDIENVLVAFQVCELKQHAVVVAAHEARQVNQQVLAGRFPVTLDDALAMAALLAQLEWGNSSQFTDPETMTEVRTYEC
jgi:hypothetical protein